MKTRGRSPDATWDEKELVERLRRGEHAAYRELVERFEASVFRLCLQMLAHFQDAEDVAQESFLRAFKGIRGFDGDRPLRPWLLGIAANRCRTALVQRRRRPLPVEDSQEFVDTRPFRGDPDDLRYEIDRALAELRCSKQRIAFHLFHEQGLSYEEIATAMKRPLNTIKTWLRRARLNLAAELTRRGVTC